VEMWSAHSNKRLSYVEAQALLQQYSHTRIEAAVLLFKDAWNTTSLNVGSRIDQVKNYCSNTKEPS
jgi:hypothetical protein